MNKKRTPEQEAISRAKKLPDRKGFVGWRMAWGRGSWPFRWGFFTNWTNFVISLGGPTVQGHIPDVPKSKFEFTFETRPFGIICFWKQKRLFWIGDWEWKKSLSKD